MGFTFFSIFTTMKLLLTILSFLLLFSACKKEQTLFVSLDSAQTHVDFNNQITENDSLNILNTEFVYNGGGVAIGDFNGDGLQDVFFTGNQVDNRLYLNKGNLQFEDITEKAQVQKRHGEWSAGINVIDINQDGKLDIYVCNTFLDNPEKRKNLLYINNGNTEGGYPTFKEMATEYGIADTTHSANAQFFDYDNDGDLDIFIGVNFMNTRYPNQYFPKNQDGSSPNRDRLYRNDWDSAKGHPVFTDISLQAGIKWDGYSHSSLISDFNNDGWLDIYVANDYVTNDLVYINQKNGTFKNEIAQIFKHQSASAMGSDIADIDNDGRLDIFTTEMLPYHNKRKKLFLSANNYTSYNFNESLGYEYQYSRNTLQLNRGLNPETGLPVFSDVSLLCDVEETEWSWTPLMADFDNDGNRDIFITNGFPRDVTANQSA
jgi:enediyne biosynthesis protein E4